MKIARLGLRFLSFFCNFFIINIYFHIEKILRSQLKINVMWPKIQISKNGIWTKLDTTCNILSKTKKKTCSVMVFVHMQYTALPHSCHFLEICTCIDKCSVLKLSQERASKRFPEKGVGKSEFCYLGFNLRNCGLS